MLSAVLAIETKFCDNFRVGFFSESNNAQDMSAPKQNLTQNGSPGSFNVIYFGVSEKANKCLQRQISICTNIRRLLNFC